ncbi:MAG: DUF1203 domain-containing protein [Erythrobacter sp.]|nr:DUF1203 domain-containing protein [Erythrobacter sp.]
MTYRIRGLDPEQFAHLFGAGEAERASHLARREIAVDGRYPCRVSLEDAERGEELLLTHFTNHTVDSPYRNAFAIYVRKSADQAAEFVDTLPPILRARPIALRCYDRDGNLHRAAISLSDDVDTLVRSLFDDPDIAYIDAHNAMHGCFAARIERYEVMA